MLQGPEVNFPAIQDQPCDGSAVLGRESTQRRQKRKIQVLDERCFRMEKELTRQAGIIRLLRAEHYTRPEKKFLNKREIT